MGGTGSLENPGWRNLARGPQLVGHSDVPGRAGTMYTRLGRCSVGTVLQFRRWAQVVRRFVEGL